MVVSVGSHRRVKIHRPSRHTHARPESHVAAMLDTAIISPFLRLPRNSNYPLSRHLEIAPGLRTWPRKPSTPLSRPDSRSPEIPRRVPTRLELRKPERPRRNIARLKFTAPRDTVSPRGNAERNGDYIIARITCEAFTRAEPRVESRGQRAAEISVAFPPGDGGEENASRRPHRDAPKSSGHFFASRTKRRGRLHKVRSLHLSVRGAQTAAVATTYGLVLMLNYRWTHAPRSLVSSAMPARFPSTTRGALPAADVSSIYR